MKDLKKILFALLAVVALASCTVVTPNAGEEAVLIAKPWFGGDEGVLDEAIPTGRTYTWITTDAIYFSIVPIRYDVAFDDIMSNDNTPLDYSTYLVLQIKEGKSPMLYKNYGNDWYKNNIEAVYRNFVREEISKYSPFDLMSNREVCGSIDLTIKNKMNDYIKKLSNGKEFPVECLEVITGRAKPNDKQLAEMNNTAAQIQAKQTQERRMEMEQAREKAERQRAISDKAYMTEMSLSPQQFIQLKAWEIIDKKDGAKIDVLFDGGQSNKMWNIK